MIEPDRCRSLLADRAADPIDDPSQDIELLVGACGLIAANREPTALRTALAEVGVAPDDAIWVTDTWRPALDAVAALDLEPPTTVDDPAPVSGSEPAPSSDRVGAPLPADGAGTYTFLFTDIEGSTHLWEQAADRMRSALALHDELLHEAVVNNGGRVFKHTGDGVCAVFASPTAAIDASIEAQIAIHHAP